MLLHTSSCIAEKAVLTAGSSESSDIARNILALRVSGSRTARDSPVTAVIPQDSSIREVVASSIS